jgi:hypothetical protein
LTAPVIEKDAPPSTGVPEGAHPITLPVMAIEGYDTADGRYLEPGGIDHHALPITLYAQTRTPDGGKGHDNADIVGAVTEMWRTPGPEVISKQTGQPFPEGTFVWSGRAWMYEDVPAFRLVKDRALSGNSVDLSNVDGVLEYAEGVDPNDPDAQPIRMRMSGTIGATTLVGQPAFPDAYVELDGELLVPEGGQAITASAVSFRSAELGDWCAPCAAGQPLATTTPVALDGAAPAAKPRRTDGMVALIPAEADSLAVDGGDPPEDLHLTLAYLGDDVMSWRPEEREAVHEVARRLTVGDKTGPDSVDVPAPDAPFGKPLEARVFSHAVFNPDGGPDGDKDPAAVYLFGDGGDEVTYFRNVVLDGVRGALGDSTLPEQHSPFHPHVTAGYGLDVNALSYTGPVKFDRLRVALGDEITDYPLGGGEESLIAAAPPLFPASAFAVPEPDQPQPLTIGRDLGNGYREVSGHVALWGTCHIGFTGRCVTPPASRSGYAYFHTGAVLTDSGELAVGTVTLGRADAGGHADLRANPAEAVAHYDRTGYAAADVRAVDGVHGIWVSGVTRDLSEEQLHAFRAAKPSGDWRGVRGSLEMVAILQVNTGGYPVPRARVASGEPVALVAAGWENVGEPASPSATFLEGSRLGLQDALAALRAEVGPVLAFARESQQQRALAEVNDLVTPELLADLQQEAEVDLFLALHGAELANWVEKAGGLPGYIKRIAKHLQAEGMDKSRAIATAVNAAKKMCATGDTSLPGKQVVNAGSRAEACAAVADWEAKRAS